jgi:hypothetical protein
MTGSSQSLTIGVLNEKPMHAALKQWYAQPGDVFEAPVDGFVIDIVRGDLLIEIQTGNFSALKGKLSSLVANHPVRLVHPIPHEKWILKLDPEPDGNRKAKRRKSPKRGGVQDVFNELVSFPEMLAKPNFSLEVLLIQEEEVRRYDGRRAWRRRGWVTEERRLLEVLSQHRLETLEDVWALVPGDLPDEFTTSDLASAMRKPRPLAQKAAYCLRKMGMITQVGKRGRSMLYSRASSMN